MMERCTEDLKEEMKGAWLPSGGRPGGRSPGALAPNHRKSFNPALGCFLCVIYDSSSGLLDSSQALGRGGV